MSREEKVSAAAAVRPVVGPVVLLVIAEPALREVLVSSLRAAGCFALAVEQAVEGERLARQLLPDVLVIDAEAVPLRARAWADELAAHDGGAGGAPRLPVVTLVPAASAEQPPGMAVAKPVRPRDLGALILRLAKGRVGPAAARPRAGQPLRVGPLEIERDQHTVRVQRGQQWLVLDLPRTEHRVLEALAAQPDRVRSREEIRRLVWPGGVIDLRTVDQYVRRLRRSLQTVGVSHWVKTVNRAGYRLQIPS